MSADLVTWLRAQLDELYAMAAGDKEFSSITAANVLREVEAKRRILDLHQRGGPDEPVEGMPVDWAYCTTCGSGEPYEYPTPWPCATLHAVAAAFADRPGYLEEWRP